MTAVFSSQITFNAAADAAGDTLKCLPHEKSAQGEMITELICLPLLKYRRPHRKSPIIESLHSKISLRPTIYR